MAQSKIKEHKNELEEKDREFRYLYAAVVALSGKLSYEEIDGVRVVTDINFNNSKAIIKLDGLMRDLGNDQDEALSIISDADHEEYSKDEYNKVYDYANDSGTPNYKDYRLELAKEFEKMNIGINIPICSEVRKWMIYL